MSLDSVLRLARLDKPAPAGKLTVARARQMTVDGWQRPKKK